LLDKL